MLTRFPCGLGESQYALSVTEAPTGSLEKMGPPGTRLTMKELFPYKDVTSSGVLKRSHVPVGEAIRGQMTYRR